MPKTRVHGEGTIKQRVYKRADGTEKTVFHALGPLDGGKRPALGVFNTRREASQALKKAQAKKDQGVILGSKIPTVEQWATQWLDRRTQISYNTRRVYETSFKATMPYIGKVRLDRLMEHHLAQMWEKLEKGLEPDGKTPRKYGPLRPTTLDRCHRNLATALGGAATGRHRLIAFNPATAEESRPPKGKREPINPFTEDEVQRLFAVTREDREHALWVFMITTGVRRGEAMALRWSDINWDRRNVSITRSLHEETGAGWVSGPTKTGRSRVISLRPDTVKTLKRLKAAQAGRQLRAAHWEDLDLVFTTSTGHALDRRWMQRLLDRACARADMPRRKLKETRHTFATLGLRAGVPVKIISEALGHASVAITLDVYSHVLPGMQEEGLAHLDRLFSS